MIGDDPIGGGQPCPRSVGQIVRIRADLLTTFDVLSPCFGLPPCASSSASGGVAPLEEAWDFGDGTPLGTGPRACHDYATGGTFLITHLVRDAVGCLAESTQVVHVFDPAGLPEISGAASGAPLLVSKSPGTIDLRFELSPFATGVYTGRVRDLHRDGYTHESSGACRIVTGSASLPMISVAIYILVVGSACEGPRWEGVYGHDSFGRVHPTAAELLRATCP